MPTSRESTVDIRRAKELWREYQRTHDVSGRRGDTAGIDPLSGRIWIGKSMSNVVDQRDAAGIDAPLFFERIGYETYLRKGRAR